MKKLGYYIVFFVSIVVLGAQGVSAYTLSGSEFQAGRIMDDGVFFNSSGITIDQIQSFLNSRVPTCDTNGSQIYSGSTTRATYGTSRGYPPPYTCLKDYVQDTPSKAAESGLCNQYLGGRKTAGQIIYDVGQSCGVSPKILIVLLQKEQSLITDVWPWSIQYRSATGYGCPDTAACDSAYYGFFNQVYNAARQFKRYGRDHSSFNYRSGRTSTIYFNPGPCQTFTNGTCTKYYGNKYDPVTGASLPDITYCGSTEVYIQNQATAGLYNYTPYQPNYAALHPDSGPTGLYGNGDTCSSYGNRNFWRMYNDWFGSPFGPTNLLDAPAAVSWGNNRIDVFGRGTDGALWQRWFDPTPGKGWQDWAKLGGTLSSGPGVSTWGPGRLDIFYTGSAGDLGHYWYGNNQWNTFESLGRPSPIVALTGSPSAISWGNNRIDVFGRGTDGALWQRWFDPTPGKGWQPWTRLGGIINSAPTVSTWGQGRLDIFSTGPAGDLQHYWFGDNQWHYFESLGRPSGGTPLDTAPGSISWGNNRIDVFGRGTDGALWQRWFDPTPGKGWQPWTRLGGIINSAPTVSTWGQGRLDIFSTGPAGDLQHYWFGDNQWHYFESLGRPRD